MSKSVSRVELTLEEYESLVAAKIKARYRAIITVLLAVILFGGAGAITYIFLRKKEPQPPEASPDDDDIPETSPNPTLPPGTTPPETPPEPEPELPGEKNKLTCFYVYLVCALVYSVGMFAISYFTGRAKFFLFVIWTLGVYFGFSIASESYGCEDNELTPCIAILLLLIASPLAFFKDKGFGLVPSAQTLKSHFDSFSGQLKQGQFRRGIGIVRNFFQRYPLVFFLVEFGFLAGTMYLVCSETASGEEIITFIVGAGTFLSTLYFNFSGIAKDVTDTVFEGLAFLRDVKGDESVDDELVDSIRNSKNSVKDTVSRIDEQLKRMVENPEVGPGDIDKLEKLKAAFVRVSNEYFSLRSSPENREEYGKVLDEILALPFLDPDTTLNLSYLKVSDDARLALSEDPENKDLKRVLAGVEATGLGLAALEGSPIRENFEPELLGQYASGLEASLIERGRSEQNANALVDSALLLYELRRSAVINGFADIFDVKTLNKVAQEVEDRYGRKMENPIDTLYGTVSKSKRNLKDIQKLSISMGEFVKSNIDEEGNLVDPDFEEGDETKTAEELGREFGSKKNVSRISEGIKRRYKKYRMRKPEKLYTKFLQEEVKTTEKD